jgi:hypothetical protein
MRRCNTRTSTRSPHDRQGPPRGRQQHISNALEGQLHELKSYPELTGQLRGALGIIGGHISTLEMLARTRGGEGGGGAIKKLGSALLGFGAAAIDLVRNEGMPKNLRDDYTAFSLATIGYVMLHTTALSLGDRETGDIARRHLADYAGFVMAINNLIPAATIKFLQDEGLPVRQDVLSEVNDTVKSVWRSESHAAPAPSDMPTAGSSR